MPSTSNALITKHEALQDLSKVYAPLGYIAPVLIKAKIFMQELWKQQLDWDEPLDEPLLQRWKGIIAEIQASLKTTLNRQCLPSDHSANISLYIFVDASILAYGTVSYITANSHVSFLMSKTRVTPIKIITLPKLELMAAFIGSALGDFFRSTLQSKFPQLTVRLWSDSQIVLYWLYTNKALKQFIANQVNFIKLLFPNADWGYCPSAENPADFTTHGITAAQLAASDLWKHGPGWLTTPSEWPLWSPNTTEILFIASEAESNLNEDQPQDSTPSLSNQPGINLVIQASNYSSLGKLLQVTAYYLWFIQNWHNRETRLVGPVTPGERSTAELMWIAHCQELHYQQEKANLLDNSKSICPLFTNYVSSLIHQDFFIVVGGFTIHQSKILPSSLTSYPHSIILQIFSSKQHILHSFTQAPMQLLLQYAKDFGFQHFDDTQRQLYKSVLHVVKLVVNPTKLQTLHHCPK